MAEIIAYENEELTIQVKVKLTGSMFEMENAILDACNEMGSGPGRRSGADACESASWERTAFSRGATFTIH